MPRQQTLRALIDWSYDLLTENEKTLLARQSIFAGGWTLEAAETVCGFDPVEEWELLDLLTNLVDKSLIQTDEYEGASRYRMLETMRQYAGERLMASGETADVEARHREFFVALGEEAAAKMMGLEQGAWLNRLEAEHDNLRAALDACASEAGGMVGGGDPAVAALAGLQLSGALSRFWLTRGYLSEGRERLAQALAAQHLIPSNADKVATGDVTWARARKATATAMRSEGIFAFCQSDYRAASALYEESLRLYRELDDKIGIASTLDTLGSVSSLQGDYAAARPLYEESLSLWRAIDDKRGIAITLGNLGSVVCFLGDYAAARPIYEESLGIQRAAGDKGGIAVVLDNLGVVASRLGDYPAAWSLHEQSLSLYQEIDDKPGIATTMSNLAKAACFREDYVTARSLHEQSLRLKRALGDRRSIAYGLEGMASVCIGEGDVRRALVLWAAADAQRASIGSPLALVEQANRNVEVEQARALSGEEAFAAAWTDGGALSWEQAVDLALAPATHA